MVDEDRRVEARETLMGRGNATTPERIAEIQRRSEELAKLGRAKPSRAFSQVMAATASDEEDSTGKEKKLRKLPKSGPRPALVHPSQREVYGTEDDVILKG
jgi:hypothetical protein